VRGRPEPPPPFRAERLYPRLRFDRTTLLAVEPNSNRFFVGERAGKIYVLPNDRHATEATVFLDTAALVERIGNERKTPVTFDSLYGLAFDPNFAENRFCYVCYVVHARGGPPQDPQGTRVSRFRVTDTDPPTADPASEELIISWLHSGHNGGCLRFGHDGCLYISSGDGGVAFPPDGLKSGQDMTTLLAKVLRIDVRRRENGRPYAIPADNPFVDLAGARGETWSYGMRNPWKMSFDRKTGELWVGDVGWELWELVYRVRKGDNYGWSIVEGSQPVHLDRPRGPTPIVTPAMEIPHTEGASITGGFVYRGKKFPQLEGTYIFGDWETRRVWGVKVDGEKLGERYELIDPTVRIVDFAEDREGELYLLDHDDGAIYGLAPNPASGQPSRFPRKLSETGLFESVAKHAPAAGVLPFSINAEQWSDHATAERWIGVPGTEPVRIHNKPKNIPGSQFSRATDWPEGAVLIKTLSLDLARGDAAIRRRIETQLLHYDGREWLGYTYEWNDDQTDATLVDRLGKSRVLQVADPNAPGGRRTQTWRFSSRGECLRCHNPWSEYTLAFNVPQLNRLHDYGPIRDNQIRTLRHIGILSDVVEPFDPLDPYLKIEPPKSPEALPRLSPPHDPSGEIDARARAYLHVNCAHCHRFNGGGSSYIYLQHHLSLAETKALGAKPVQGTFGIDDAQILAAGDPYRSVLFFRLAKTGPGHMPHLGAKIVDERGLALIHDWIRQLPVRPDDAAKIDRLVFLDEPAAVARERDEAQRTEWLIARRMAQQQKRDLPNDEELAQAKKQAADQAKSASASRAAERQKLVGELMATPSRAVLLAEALRHERLPTGIRALVMQAALGSSTDPAIRDLFEAFIPEEQRTQRLGEAINPAELLKLAGDLARGRQLFHESTTVQCRSCHRIGGKGTEVGPDLDAVGKKHDRAKLLENILQPSLVVEPKYATWAVMTKDGVVLAGLLVERTDDAVVLRDAQNKTHRVAADEIEQIRQQPKSLMPDLLVRDLTAQQVADLLEYLASLRADVPPPK
jgi:putative heme-binding domain-containing protein